METGDLLRELVQFLEQAAPMVWAVARRQVWVIAVQQSIAILGLGTVAWLLGKQYWKISSNRREYVDPELAQGTCVLIGGICAALCVALGLGLVGRIVNPDYYAAGLLLQYIR